MKEYSRIRLFHHDPGRTMRPYQVFLSALMLISSVLSAQQVHQFTAKDLLLAINSHAKVITVADSRTGTNYLDTTRSRAFAVAYTATNRIYADRFIPHNDSIVELQFFPLSAYVTLSVRKMNEGIRWEVISCSDSRIIKLDLFNCTLSIGITEDERFGVSLLATSLNSHVAQSPVLQNILQFSVYRRFGMEQASVFLTGSSPRELKRILRSAVPSLGGLPFSPYGGVFADTSSYAYGSYVMTYGSLNEASLEAWKHFLGRSGFPQVQFHGGTVHSFRFGDLTTDRRYWNEGWNSVRKIVDSLHVYGIQSTLHTYSFLIDKHSSYVTPVPHPDLAYQDSILVLKEINDLERGISISSPRADGSSPKVAIGATLRIGNELIVVTAMQQRINGMEVTVERGAFGTTRQKHRKGSVGRIVKEIYGYFSSVPGSSLFFETARKHAEVINQCGFDGVYLDAIDAVDQFDPSEGWYWSAAYVLELWKHLRFPIGMDMGAMTHHFWRFRSRWQAWDTPTKGFKHAVDIHCAVNASGTLLPKHLGWWDWEPVSQTLQSENESRSDFEYLVRKCIETRAGISFVGEPPVFAPDTESLNWKLSALHELNGTLRRRVYPLSDTAIPSRSFTIAVTAKQESTVFTIDSSETIKEIKILHSVQTTKCRSLMEILKRASSVPIAQTQGASMRYSFDDGLSFAYNPTYSGDWAAIRYDLPVPLDLSGHSAIGVHIHGDSSNGTMDIRLESEKSSQSKLFDRFIRIDFRGWRWIYLVEPNHFESGNGKWPQQSEEPWRFFRGEIDLRSVQRLTILLSAMRDEMSVSIDSIISLPVYQAQFDSVAVKYPNGVIQILKGIKYGEKIEFNTNSDYFTSHNTEMARATNKFIITFYSTDSIGIHRFNIVSKSW